jgi:hypothetical protein
VNVNSNVSYFYSISLAVCLHAIILLWLYYSFEKKSILLTTQRVIVKTIDLKPIGIEREKQGVMAAQEPPTKKELQPYTTPPKQTKPPQKKSLPAKPKPQAKKTPASSPKKSSLDNTKKALLEKAKETLANIQAPALQDNPSLKEKESFKSLAFVSSSVLKNIHPMESDLNYQDELKSHLKLLLKLPETGNVIIDLTLDRMGMVKKVVIIEAISPSNRKYIEKTLPLLKLPPFGIYFKGVGERTFRLELRGEI